MDLPAVCRLALLQTAFICQSAEMRIPKGATQHEAGAPEAELPSFTEAMRADRVLTQPACTMSTPDVPWCPNQRYDACSLLWWAWQVNRGVAVALQGSPVVTMAMPVLACKPCAPS